MDCCKRFWAAGLECPFCEPAGDEVVAEPGESPERTGRTFLLLFLLASLLIVLIAFFCG